MDGKVKNILKQHKPFLVRNIVWTDELTSQLKEQGLLTEFMLKDIQTHKRREEKVSKFIDLLALKGNAGFQKFLDVLHLTGHVFIAEFLRNDDGDQKILDVTEMYQALPFLKSSFNDSERKQIETYFSERVEAQVMKMLWNRNFKEREKALDARQEQIEQAMMYEEQFQEKADKIRELEKDIQAGVEDKQELKTKMAALINAHTEMQQKHEQAISVQMKFNEANDKTIQKNVEKLSSMKDLLRIMKEKIECLEYLSPELHEKEKVLLEEESKQNGKDATKLKFLNNEFVFLLKDIELLARKFKRLLEIKKNYEKLLEEKEYILLHFGKLGDGRKKIDSGQTEGSLIEAYQEFVIRNDENFSKMKQEIEKYDEMLEQNKATMEDLKKEKDQDDEKMFVGAQTWQAAIMGVMRKQLQDIKADLRKKESLVSVLEEETVKLKLKISKLEEDKLVSCKTDESCSNSDIEVPNSKDEIEANQKNANKVTKVKNLPPLKQTIGSSKISTSSTSPRFIGSKHRPLYNRPIVNEPVSFDFPGGIITTQVKPEARALKGVGMGSTLGNLKTMNKYNRTNNEDTKSGSSKHSTGLK